MFLQQRMTMQLTTTCTAAADQLQVKEIVYIR